MMLDVYKHKIDIGGLKQCMANMAFAMQFKPLTEEKSQLLLDHVLYDGLYNDQQGKQGLEQLHRGMITERELRNLLMAHCATKISNENKCDEPGCDKYSSRELCREFELAIFGRPGKLYDMDVWDPWKK